MFQEILAQTNWEGVGVAVSMVLATATAGYVVKDRAKTKRQRTSEDAERGILAVDFKERCDDKHAALDRLMDERQGAMEHRFDDLKCVVEKGFDRIEKSLNGHKA